PRLKEIYEVILSTFNDDGTPDAAPMGIRFLTRRSVQVRFYQGSRTLRNVLERGCAVANLTCDANLFYRTAFKEKGGLPRSYFSRPPHVDAPLLRSADGYIELMLRRIGRVRHGVLAEFRVGGIHRKDEAPIIYSRGPHALIEATIHATRIREFLNDKRRVEEVKRLTQLINHYKGVIERVCPDSEYEKAIRELRSRIRGWKSVQSTCEDTF
ncbi:DUF447 family protein, partial [Candidatus Bathyarchaeota archaeon]|nr:DUF447 family protein [Candidatus Bathyarchaeota archaeon]